MAKAKIFEVSHDIPDIHIHPKGKKPKAPEGVLQNHRNDGGHLGDQDDVSRSHHPDAHDIGADIME